MKPKMICKLGIDLIMIVLLLLLMAKQLTGNLNIHLFVLYSLQSMYYFYFPYLER